MRMKFRDDKQLVKSIILALIANFTDYVSTVCALSSGSIELNPIMRLAIENNKFALVKLAIPMIIIIYSAIRINSMKSLIRVRRIMSIVTTWFALATINNVVSAYIMRSISN